MYPISEMARRYVRSRATDAMRYTCQIERVTHPQVRSDLTAIAGGKTILYTGICRIWEVSGGGSVVIGETDVSLQNTYISIPWDVPTVPQRNDEILILTSPDEPELIGKRFQINEVNKAGELRPTRRFQVTMVQAKR